MTTNKKTQDLGVQGQTFVIQERSLLEVIQEKLNLAEKTGKLKELQQKFADKVKAKVKRPNPVSFIKHTEFEREHIFDPSYTQAEAIKDHLGRVVVKAGTTVNPLDHIEWGEPLIFIDGEEAGQVSWALKQVGKIVLVKGAPLELEATHQRPMFFDQAGILSKKFGIRQVPAKVVQEDKVLKIQEIKP